MELLNDNLVMDTDSYKFSHWPQYPKNTSYMFSYLESRGGKYAQTLFTGLQPILKRLEKGFTMENVEEARTFAAAHGEPFNYEGWKRMFEKHGGKLPVRIRAVPEGFVIPTSNILMSVESTDPEFFWVVSWLETLLLRVWYPITVATQSYYIRQLIMEFLEKTSDDPLAEIDFKLHDFGSRGVSSAESASIGGAAHLCVFKGSDTVNGVRHANHYYKAQMAGFSIPASEHSTMTMWGGRDGEVKAMENMIDAYGKSGSLFACVSDSYDIFNAVEKLWGDKLRDKIINCGGTLVIRPDSGDPVEVLTKLCAIAEDRFGFGYNKKGYKVFNNIRFIWGDGINQDSIRRILTSMTGLGYSATNFAFGMGGALLQQVNRDTQKFAFKCSHATVDGKGVDVFKEPITDKGKNSKRGQLDLTYSLDQFKTVNGHGTLGSVMKTVFDNGVVTKEYTLDDVRRNVLEFSRGQRN
jgi:nicotinamide phosphoribosyltransferase